MKVFSRYQTLLYLTKTFVVETLYYCNLLCYVKCPTSFEAECRMPWTYITRSVKSWSNLASHMYMSWQDGGSNHPIHLQQLFKSRAIKGREGWLSLGVVAQWQSAGDSNQRPWVRSPAAPPFFLSLCRFKGLRTVTAPICLSLDDDYWSSDCGRIPSIGLSMLWLRLPSIMINNCTQQSSHTSSCYTPSQLLSHAVRSFNKWIRWSEKEGKVAQSANSLAVWIGHLHEQ